VLVLCSICELAFQVAEKMAALATLPTEYLHSPWTAPTHVLKSANVELGSTYPAPIVDHDVARKKALAAYARLRGKE
jgi:deoxyribodipyrimidine photo-lyase